MNKTESLYAELLEARRQAGEIDEWKFEALTFHLNQCTYTPDFVTRRKSEIVAIEVKACTKYGRVLAKDDSLVKLKWAAEAFPWIKWLMAARLRDGDWKYRSF